MTTYGQARIGTHDVDIICNFCSLWTGLLLATTMVVPGNTTGSKQRSPLYLHMWLHHHAHKDSSNIVLSNQRRQAYATNLQGL
jgi:hypothetical protein